MRVPWVVALALLVIAAGFVAARPLALLIYAVGAVWLAASWVTGRVARSLHIRQSLSTTHVTPGQAVEVVVEVTNRAPVPVPWLWLREPLPVHLEAGASFAACDAVAPGGLCRQNFVFRPTRRGRYRIGRIEFALGDWFGLCRAEGRVDLPLWVTVYPPVVPLPPLPLFPRQPVGPRRQPASPFREELPIGLRDYVPGDPLRAIAWKATARRGVLQVREFPRVRERRTTLVVDLDPRAWRTPVAARCRERALSVAASFLWAPPGGEHPVGLLAYARTVRYVAEGTGVLAEPGRVVHVRPRLGLAHRQTLLEILATLHPEPGPGLGGLLSTMGHRLAPGEACLVFTGGHDADAWAAAAALAARHHPVLILAFESRALPPCPGARVLAVTTDGDVRWS